SPMPIPNPHPHPQHLLQRPLRRLYIWIHPPRPASRLRFTNSPMRIYSQHQILELLDRQLFFNRLFREPPDLCIVPSCNSVRAWLYVSFPVSSAPITLSGSNSSRM